MDHSKDTAILVVSFGTSNHETREKTIGGIERAIAAAFPQYEVRRAFTSGFITRKLKQQGIMIDDVETALDHLVLDGFRNLIVQPTHLMQGKEYDKLIDELREAEGSFDSIATGAPLLAGTQDIEDVISAVDAYIKQTIQTLGVNGEKTAVLFMGHGSGTESDEVYTCMQEHMAARGLGDYYIATVEGTPSFQEVKEVILKKDYQTIVLEPLMVVAGEHALNDMAGENDSWKTILEDDGYDVHAIMQGLGELPPIQKIYIRHVKKAITS